MNPRHAGEATARPPQGESFDAETLRRDFPILDRQVHGRPLVYLDNAASTQRPRAVLDAMRSLYETSYANVHRGVHRLSVEATEAYELARVKLQRFINAASPNEIVFTSGTTGAINLVAHSFGARHVGRDDEIVLTCMEHHSNIVPWQLLCERSGARLRVAPINDRGELLLDELEALLNERTRLVTIVHTSNALGTRNPIAEVVQRAHARGIPVLVDGAQAMPHDDVDVQALGCDFFAMSGHKMYGPTGIGALYGKFEQLDALPPFLGGGEMIESVTFEKTTFKHPPHRFEAGTPPIAEAVGMGAAVDYLSAIGMPRIAAYERELLEYATGRLGEIPGLQIVGTARDKASILSFTVDGVHPHDLGTAVDLEGVAVRAGNHCAQPVMQRLGIHATARASLSFYNTRDDVDRLVQAIHKAIEVLG